jgi:hypothetical protein
LQKRENRDPQRSHEGNHRDPRNPYNGDSQKGRTGTARMLRRDREQKGPPGNPNREQQRPYLRFPRDSIEGKQQAPKGSLGLGTPNMNALRGHKA